MIDSRVGTANRRQHTYGSWVCLCSAVPEWFGGVFDNLFKWIFDKTFRIDGLRSKDQLGIFLLPSFSPLIVNERINFMSEHVE
jgi:hypothetical protein